MLFGYVPVQVDDQEEVRLCVLPSAPDIMSRPLRLDLIKPTKTAVYFLSPQEAVMSHWDEEKNALVVVSVIPSVIYLTPDLPDKPGIMARKLRIKENENGEVAVEYARKVEEPWIAWDPLERVR